MLPSYLEDLTHAQGGVISNIFFRDSDVIHMRAVRLYMIRSETLSLCNYVHRYYSCFVDGHTRRHSAVVMLSLATAKTSVVAYYFINLSQ